MKKIITFIIVTWNNSDTIVQCLDSIYRYCKDFKVIIVDNNSNDDTTKKIKNDKYTDCKIILSDENLGFAKANNIALEKVDTEYICYLNPDTILLEDIIVPSINILKSNSNVGIVGCKLLYKNLKLQPSTFNFLNAKQVYIENLRIGKLFPNFIREKYFPNNSACKKNKYVDWVIGAEMILSTKDAKKVEGFSIDYYMYTEDMDLCKKIANLGKKCYYLSDVRLIHIGGVSESKNINYNKIKIILRNKLIFINKFYSKKEANKAFQSLLVSYRLKYLFTFAMVPFSHKKALYYREKMLAGKSALLELQEKLEVK